LARVFKRRQESGLLHPGRIAVLGGALAEVLRLDIFIDSSDFPVSFA
jgi:hypothetical protein